MLIRNLIAAFLAGTLMVAPDTVITEYDAKESEIFLWECLSTYTDDEKLVAAIVGYYYRESRYRSDAVTGWDYSLAFTGIDPCREFAERLDTLSRDDFVVTVRKRGGFGLGQWYSVNHLEQMYDYFKGAGASFADARTQCAFTVHSITNNAEVMEQLEQTDTVLGYGGVIARQYDGSEAAVEGISGKAYIVYTKYAKNPSEA